jgi:eukaryotic-like serine/threonine-protein kinase
MGFWSFLRKKAGASAPPDPAREEPAPASSADPLPKEIATIARVGRPDGPTIADAVARFRILRQSPDEGRAVHELARLHTERALPEDLAVAVASALVDRGEPELALKLLASIQSSAALLLRADLYGATGDVPTALALTERVLLRDLDHPGARDRHRRWREALGYRDEAKREAQTGATVVTREPDAPFLLLREVARGGAGAVYEAEDRELSRKVALKVYHHVDRDRAQLAHEARVAAELAGPGIVRVFDADPAHGWLALEWAPLGAIRDHVRAKDRATLAPVERWALPLATALARVHAGGWVHHDVKPANVLLVTPDMPLLADFGIARRLGEPSPAGSIGYVSPERLKGRASDPRDDVYGFGRLLEDVLDALADPALEKWRPIASACVGPDDVRPADARALVIRLRVEG